MFPDLGTDVILVAVVPAGFVFGAVVETLVADDEARCWLVSTGGGATREVLLCLALQCHISAIIQLARF